MNGGPSLHPMRGRLRTLLAPAAAALLIVFVALGPFLAPHDPAAPVAAPWTPGGGHLLGTDALGRDVLSRTLAGGRHLLAVSALAAAVACLLGTLGGLAAAGSRPAVRRTIGAAADLLLAVPALLPAMLLAAALPGDTAIVAATAVASVPLTVRIVADAAARALGSGFVRAARLRGERPAGVLVREVVPSLSGLLAADFGLRFVTALQLACALGVLGFDGDTSQTGDWAVMLRENLPGAALNPAALTAPALLLTALALSVAATAHAAARTASGTGAL